MADDSELETVIAELNRYGIKPDILPTGSGHRLIRWLFKNESRTLTVASTGSDYRGRMNMRSRVRRLLREDGFHPLMKRSQRPTGVAKLFELPGHVDPIPDQLAVIRAELDDLATMLIDVSDTLAFIKASLTPKKLEVLEVSKKPRKGGRQNIIGNKTVSALTDQPQTAKMIWHKAGLTSEKQTRNALTQLCRAKRAIKVGRGKWKLPQE